MSALVDRVAVHREHVLAEEAVGPRVLEGFHPVHLPHHVHLSRPEMGREPQSMLIGGSAQGPQELGRRGGEAVRGDHAAHPSLGGAVALARETDGPIELLPSHPRIEHRLSPHHPLEIDVMGHEPDRCPDSRTLDEGQERFGVLLHLEYRGHAPADQLRDREAAERFALVAAHHHAHRQVEAVDGTVADILGAAAEHRVSEVVVRADEAGQRDAPLRVDGLAPLRRPRGDLVARPDRDDARAVDEHRAGRMDRSGLVHGDDRGVTNQQRHRVPPRGVIEPVSDPTRCARLALKGATTRSSATSGR